MPRQNPNQEEPFIDDQMPEDLCVECGFGEWRHGKDNHPCKKFVRFLSNIPHGNEALSLSFSDLVQLVRKEYSNKQHNIGYAEAAKIVDKAIEPQAEAHLEAARREAEAKGILRGRKAETDLLREIAQNDDRLTPDEFEAILLVLNDRLKELDKTDYRKGATWTV